MICDFGQELFGRMVGISALVGQLKKQERYETWEYLPFFKKFYDEWGEAMGNTRMIQKFRELFPLERFQDV